ncbi:hypothetical protein RND81_08G217700 [Saponaria officinalis]|uniref:Uncharacterized protein n=1 Tax=Saponaria officinalis TaxID=3572 RepID=A0AAW1JBE7_SAPOF
MSFLFRSIVRSIEMNVKEDTYINLSFSGCANFICMFFKPSLCSFKDYDLFMFAMLHYIALSPSHFLYHCYCSSYRHTDDIFSLLFGIWTAILDGRTFLWSMDIKY